MKKIYLSVIALAVGASAFAQQGMIKQEVTTAVAKGVFTPVHSVAAADPTDTLGFDELGANLILYSAQSGYVFGSNDLVNPANPVQHQYNLEYARGFILNDPYTVMGAGFIFGHKEDVSGSPADAKVNLHMVAPNRAISDPASAATDAPGPASAALATANLAFADADTAFPSLSFVDFTTEAWVGADFAISLDISPLYSATSDTLVLLADEDGDSDGDYTWTRLAAAPTATNAQRIWAKTTAMLQGGLDVNLAIFAVVAESGVGIEEQGFMNGVKVTTFPNPALSSDNVTIQYGLETAAKNVDLNIYTLNGQLAYTSAQGAKASGIHNLNVPAQTLTAGSYIYTIDADGRRMAKKMEILK